MIRPAASVGGTPSCLLKTIIPQSERSSPTTTRGQRYQLLVKYETKPHPTYVQMHTSLFSWFPENNLINDMTWSLQTLTFSGKHN